MALLCAIDQMPNPIISDEDGKVALYLRHIHMLWQIGLKNLVDPTRSSRPVKGDAP